ncbi:MULTISPECIES: PepSY domain-containing protein [Asticcacaulis]|uniref:PepSY-associated TM helix domain-containing protein n=1 Tax=Asticcacaulis TaxID=76890 RepID=UPI001AE8A1A4|nr:MULTISPECIES: PepSY domain-containing protein [Asticcacaulis]MBP2158303.1 putative iron-regulated membrane protein [Asticcacaulis solisilvae]MDR6799348.1 putative iron-regulated membrane protein [Asticcacaulis sp. BE141]
MTEPGIKLSGEAAKRLIIDYRMIWRWHFYAGLVCIPFIVLLAVTGTCYLFKPQIEAALDARYNNLPFEGAPRPVSEQIFNAMHALHGAELKQVELRKNPHDALRVVMNDGGELWRVYIHPQTLDVLKVQAEDQRFMAIIKTIHGELTLGRFGEIIVELAACWAIVMIVTGLYLWWPRNAQGPAGVLFPRLRIGKRVFWRDMHAVTGIWISFFALFLLLSGLPWTSVWGGAFRAVVAATKPATAKAEWAAGRAAETKALKDEHAHHDQSAQKSVLMSHDMGVNLTGVDALAPRVLAIGLPAPVLIKPVKDTTWQATSATQNLTARFTVTYDAATGHEIKRETFGDKALVDRVVATGISAHEGHLFGWLNQLLGLLTAIGLVTLCISAVVMWWQRRPTDVLGAPALLPDERLGMGLGALIMALGIFLPVLGISLIVVALAERLVLRNIPAVCAWLGLKHSLPPA